MLHSFIEMFESKLANVELGYRNIPIKTSEYRTVLSKYLISNDIIVLSCTVFE
jgi:hypothetical protein